MKKEFFLLIVIICMLACHQPDTPRKLPGSAAFKKAETFLNQQRIDSSFYYFEKVTTVSKDSLEIAMAYNYMATIQTDAGDHYGAQESLTTSLRYLNESKKQDRYCLASNYNELGMTSSKLKNYDAAIGYFDLAINFTDDPSYRLIFLNNQANAYREKENFKQALDLYQQVLGQTSRNGKEYARLLTNMATTKWLLDPSYNAAPELLKALKIRETIKDLRGQHASFAHLSDYYNSSSPALALNYASRMYMIANQLHIPDGQLTALQKLIKLSPSADAKRYFERYERLNDSLQTVRNAAKNQFTLIRYEVERRKTENLRLLKDNAEKKYQLVIRNALLVAGFVLLVIIIVSGFLWYNKWKKRKEEEKQEAVLETRRKASKDVHDSLSNDIYLLMKRIKHDQVLDRNWMLTHTEHVYKRSRNISYEILSDTDEFFPARIGELLKSFGTDDTKISLVGNEPALWQKVPSLIKPELRFILQELMVNMQKHSQAANVVIKFEIREDTCLIIYIDDGTGIPADTVYQNGLTNTGNRIKAMGGQITFGNNDGKGLRIDISFPIT